VSEELEHSLQQAIETYLNDRLRSIDEQLERLQREMSEGLAQLREQSAEHRLDGTAVSAAIFAHLQTARSERLSAGPTVASPSANSADLKRAVQELEAQQSQTDILKSLLRGGVQHANRVALFVVKNDQAIGWRMAKADDPDLEMIGGVSLPVTAQTIVTRAVRTKMTASGADAADSDYAMLLDQLGGAPAVVAAVPLVVRGKVVAVLYADSPSTDRGAMDLDAVELLTRVASMAVNLVSIQRTSAPAAAETATAPAEPGYIPQIEESTAAEEPAAEATPVEGSFEAAAVEPAQAEALQPAEAVEPQIGEAPPSSFASVWGHPSAGEQSSQATSTDLAEATAPTEPLPAPEELPRSSSVEPETIAPASTPEPQPMASDSGYSSSYSAPLGTSRRYGVSEPELPVEVDEDERRLHTDARRFARLLVSEIKLYNEPKVQEGRSKGDLYERLRDDIDRSRQMYDKRVAPPVAARHDYFHQELVNTLAEGDVSKLGMSYPGAAMSSN
jgi:hypothetical protein